MPSVVFVEPATDELDCRLLGDGSGIFHVERRLELVPATHDPRIFSDHGDLRVVGRQAVRLSKELHLAKVDVAAPKNRDGLSTAIDTRGVERSGVIDGGQVARHECALLNGVVVPGVFALGERHLAIGGCGPEIVQRQNARDHRGKAARDLRVA